MWARVRCVHVHAHVHQTDRGKFFDAPELRRRTPHWSLTAVNTKTERRPFTFETFTLLFRLTALKKAVHVHLAMKNYCLYLSTSKTEKASVGQLFHISLCYSCTSRTCYLPAPSLVFIPIHSSSHFGIPTSKLFLPKAPGHPIPLPLFLGRWRWSNPDLSSG